MSPYLAIIKDSFREALASRVLWILVVMITLVLLSLAPIGWRWRPTTGVREEDLRRIREFATHLRAAERAPEGSVQRHIWSMFSVELQQELRDQDATDSNGRFRSLLVRARIASELNSLSNRDDLYRPEIWKQAALDNEGQRLAARGAEQLTQSELRRLNRLALEVAFPAFIRTRASNSVQFFYFAWNVGPPVPLSQEQLNGLVNFAVAGFMKVFVGILGVFSAILVTAPIIPNMFDAGSINLLLSKPISRPLLFLAKFAGGCWYVLINAAYLIAGLWLLVGWRFEIWNHRLLLCIPIFLFLFAIYYSISSFTALIWRNPIVSIVCTILFWGACLSVGASKHMVELFFIQPNRIVDVFVADDSLLARTEGGDLKTWDAAVDNWQDVGESNRSRSAGPTFMQVRRTVGPIYDGDNERLVSAEPGWQNSTLYTREKANRWRQSEGISAPADVKMLFLEDNGQLLAATAKGLYRQQGGKDAPSRKLELFGIRVPLPGQLDSFQSVGPDPFPPFSENAAFAFDQIASRLILWDQGQITIFQRETDGSYQTIEQSRVSDYEDEVLLAVCSGKIVVARSDGRVQLFEAESLTEQTTFVPYARNQPRFVVTDRGSRWVVVLFHHRRMAIIDVEQQTMRKPPLRDISAVSFSGHGQLMVADRMDRVTQYQLPDLDKLLTRVPSMDLLHTVFRFALVPFHSIFPKPSELDDTISYVLTQKQSESVNPEADRLSGVQVQIRPWSPVWSGLAFVAVVLAVSCVYIQRQDF